MKQLALGWEWEQLIPLVSGRDGRQPLEVPAKQPWPMLWPETFMKSLPITSVRGKCGF